MGASLCRDGRCYCQDGCYELTDCDQGGYAHIAISADLTEHGELPPCAPPSPPPQVFMTAGGWCGKASEDQATMDQWIYSDPDSSVNECWEACNAEHPETLAVDFWPWYARALSSLDRPPPAPCC